MRFDAAAVAAQTSLRSLGGLAERKAASMGACAQEGGCARDLQACVQELARVAAATSKSGTLDGARRALAAARRVQQEAHAQAFEDA